MRFLAGTVSGFTTFAEQTRLHRRVIQRAPSDRARWLATDRHLAQSLTGKGLQENIVARAGHNRKELMCISRSHYTFSCRAVLTALAVFAASVWSGLFQFGNDVNDCFKAYSFRNIP